MSSPKNPGDVMDCEHVIQLLRATNDSSNKEEINEYIFKVCAKSTIHDKFMKTVLDWKAFYPNIRTKDREETILHLLTKNNNLIWIEKLLARKDVKIDAKCAKRKTALLLAAEHGHLDVLKLLLSHEADVNCTDSVNNSALHLACKSGNLDCVQYLVETVGLDLNLENRYRDTPLFSAVLQGHDHVCNYLLEHGANVNHRDENGKTVLFTAVYKNYTQCMKTILSYVPEISRSTFVNAKSKKGTNTLYSAVFNNHLSAVNILLEQKVDVNQLNDGKSMLMLSAVKDHTNIMSALIEAGADLDKQNELGSCALHFAGSKNHLESAKLLLDAGANPNIAGESGKTPLKWAADKGQFKLVLLFVNPKYKADVDTKDLSGDTPLISCCRKGRDAMAKVLLKAGANPALTNAEGESAFDVAPTEELRRLLKG